MGEMYVPDDGFSEFGRSDGGVIGPGRHHLETQLSTCRERNDSAGQRQEAVDGRLYPFWVPRKGIQSTGNRIPPQPLMPLQKGVVEPVLPDQITGVLDPGVPGFLYLVSGRCGHIRSEPQWKGRWEIGVVLFGPAGRSFHRPDRRSPDWIRRDDIPCNGPDFPEKEGNDSGEYHGFPEHQEDHFVPLHAASDLDTSGSPETIRNASIARWRASFSFLSVRIILRADRSSACSLVVLAGVV